MYCAELYCTVLNQSYQSWETKSFRCTYCGIFQSSKTNGSWDLEGSTARDWMIEIYPIINIAGSGETCYGNCTSNKCVLIFFIAVHVNHQMNENMTLNAYCQYLISTNSRLIPCAWHFSSFLFMHTCGVCYLIFAENYSLDKHIRNVPISVTFSSSISYSYPRSVVPLKLK